MCRTPLHGGASHDIVIGTVTDARDVAFA